MSDHIKVARPRKACVVCRRLKTRCLPQKPTDDPPVPCSRCIRLQLVCEYKSQRRGPPKGSRRSERADATETGAPQVAESSGSHISPNQSPSHSSSRSHPRTKWDLSVGRPFITLGAPQQRNPTVEAYLETDLDEDAPVLSALRRSNVAEVIIPDAISVGLLTEPEARWLFKRFEQDVSPSSHLFDHQFHTYDRVRRSPALFNAIMYAAARFFRPDVADWCLDMAETAILRATRKGDVDIPLVQALLTLVYWKRPHDPTAYYKLGHATRMICQLGVEWQIDGWEPSLNEEEERAKVDVERTIYNAFGMDGSYGIMFRLPTMGWPIPKVSELHEWRQNHAHLGVTGDLFKVFLTECWEMHDVFGNLFHPGVAEESAASSAKAIERMEAFSGRWLNQPDLQGVLRSIAILMTKQMMMKELVTGLDFGLSTTSAVLDLLDDLAPVVLDLITSGEVIFFSDMSSISLSMPVKLCYHMRHRLSPQDMTRTQDTLRLLSTALGNLLPLTTEDHPLQYVERCYRRILSALERYQSGQDSDNVLSQLEQFLNQIWTAGATQVPSSEDGLSTDFWLYPTHVV